MSLQHKSRWISLTLCQMCGVNVIAYYSTQIFRDAGSTVQQALLFSLGAGIINWIGAIPGTLTIDKAGRRALLLTTFPLMFLCLLFTGCGFYAPSLETRSGLVGTGIYLFMVVYSPGMGPVPFTYSAEAQVSFLFQCTDRSSLTTSCSHWKYEMSACPLRPQSAGASTSSSP